MNCLLMILIMSTALVPIELLLKMSRAPLILSTLLRMEMPVTETTLKLPGPWRGGLGFLCRGHSGRHSVLLRKLATVALAAVMRTQTREVEVQSPDMKILIEDYWTKGLLVSTLNIQEMLHVMFSDRYIFSVPFIITVKMCIFH